MLTRLIDASLRREVAPDALLDVFRDHAEGADDDELRELAARVHDYVGSLPGALRELSALSSQRGRGRAAAFVAGQVLVYLLDDADLLPESAFGALGLVDDAFLAHTAVAMLRSSAPGEARESAYVPPDAPTTQVIRALMPLGVAESLERTCDSLVRVATALFGEGGDAVAEGGRQIPQLGVRRAIKSLARS